MIYLSIDHSSRRASKRKFKFEEGADTLNDCPDQPSRQAAKRKVKEESADVAVSAIEWSDQPSRQAAKRESKKERIDETEAKNDVPNILKKFRGLANSIQTDPNLMNQGKVKESLDMISEYARLLNNTMMLKTEV